MSDSYSKGKFMIKYGIRISSQRIKDFEFEDIFGDRVVPFFYFLCFSQYFLQLRELVGINGYMWMFAIASFACTIFTYIFVPETKGKSIEEIAEMFRNDSRKASSTGDIEKDSFDLPVTIKSEKLLLER